jgi:hypothetical protein
MTWYPKGCLGLWGSFGVQGFGIGSIQFLEFVDASILFFEAKQGISFLVLEAQVHYYASRIKPPTH